MIDHGPSGGCKAAGGSVLVVGGHRGFARGREVGETDGGRKKRKCQCTKVPTLVQKYPKYKVPEIEKSSQKRTMLKCAKAEATTGLGRLNLVDALIPCRSVRRNMK